MSNQWLRFARWFNRRWMPKQLGKNEAVPYCFGVSYRYWNRRATTCHPIPLNYVVGLYVKIHLWFLLGWRPSALERALRLAYNRGYREARQ